MFKRSLPRFPDLGSFLAWTESNNDLVRVGAPVDTHLEMTEIHRRTIATGGPVLRFDRPVALGTRSSIPAVANVFGTRRRVAAGLGIEPSDLEELGRLLAWMRSPTPPRSFGSARHALPAARLALKSRPAVERRDFVHEGFPPDLSLLPVQTCWPGDAGPLVTWPTVVTRPPGPDDPAGYNLGVYRMQVLDRTRAILRWLPMRGGAAHHRQWAKLGRDMPVCIVIGADPATMLAAVMPAPEGVSELSLAGIIAGARPRLLPCQGIPMNFPAGAEIVLEGTVSATQTAMEGPFGDHTGYYNQAEPYPVFTLDRIRVRKDPVYMTTFTGRAPDEPSVIGDALADVFRPLLFQQIPEVRDFWLPPEACSYRIAVVSIDKRYPGQARRVMAGLWSLLPQFMMTKIVIVVDDDIDVRSWPDVMWAVSTRMDPSRDLMTLERTAIDHLDFASPLEGLGGKLGIDATNKIGAETSRAWGEPLRMDREVTERVAARWFEYFPGRADPGASADREHAA